MTRLRRLSGGKLWNAFGSKSGAEAIARISPLYGSITTTLPDLAWCCSIDAPSSRSAANCTPESSERTSDAPSRAGRLLAVSDSP